MKIVYNTEYGGFSWPPEIVEKFGLHGWNDASRANRTNPEIVARIEQIVQPYIERRQQFVNQRKQLTGDQLNKAYYEYRKWYENRITNLGIAVIPDDATDWMVSDYDGMETIYFVRNGKLYFDTEDGLGEPVNGEE